jgi:regulator of sigma E protease
LDIVGKIQQTVTLLIILSILVVAHEWGHFIVARLCGIRVDDFSIGFGKRLFRIGKRGDTEYNVRMLPLGGFVKIAGMEPDEAPLVAAKDKMLNRNASDPDASQIPLIAENIGENTAYTAPDGFYSKPLWQRALVILAGPVMSFVFGYVVFCLMGWTIGIPSGKVLPRIGMVSPGGEGQKIGLRMGDVITAIDGQPVTDGKAMIARINGSLGKMITLTVQRSGETLTKAATPRQAMENGKPVIYTDVVSPGTAGTALGLLPGDTIRGIGSDKVNNADQALRLLRENAGKPVDVDVTRVTADDQVVLHGILPASFGPNVLPNLNSHPIGVLKINPSSEIQRLSFADSVRAGTAMTGLIFMRLGEMVQQPRQLKENAGGIIFMYQATGFAVKNGLVEEVSLMASLSLSLAIFNMLPIPILDGGHLLTFFIEWVRRGKRLTERQQQAFMMTGLTIIGFLFLLIMSNDIIRTVTHQLPQ